MQVARIGPFCRVRVRQFIANRQSRDGRNKEMRSILCLLVVCLFATTAAAQFGAKVELTREMRRRPRTQRKRRPTNEKGHPGKAAAADQAGADAELADALLIAMDADHDGVVTKIEYRGSDESTRKVHKDNRAI